MSNLVLLPLILLHLILQLFNPCSYKGIVITTIVLQLLFLHVDNICANTIQEILKNKATTNEKSIMGYSKSM